MAKGLSQEAFHPTSSRWYLGKVENGAHSPTIEKLDTLGRAMSVHPLAILTQAYLIQNPDENIDQLFDLIRQELDPRNLIPDSKFSLNSRFLVSKIE